MGLPVVQAESEAEAQCSELVRHGKAWAVATEDMDALTFGSPILLRHLTFSAAAKRPVAEYHIDRVLAALGLTMDQFIDLCILLGCDYTGKIPGIGPQKAFEGIKAHGSIEGLIANMDPVKHAIPEGSFDYVGARALFKQPPVKPAAEVEIVFGQPDEEGLRRFLIEERLFNAERVESGITRLKKALARKTQGRLDQFFTVIPRAIAPAAAAAGKKPTGHISGGKRPAGATDAAPPAQARKLANGAKKAVQK
jgi:flap endonuclease-1